MILCLLADESVQFATIEELRKHDFDILSILESFRGVTDPEVLRIANETKRIILTEDKDFGELTFRLRKQNEGIVLVRLATLPASDRPIFVLDALNKIRNEIHNSFTVIISTKIRIRKMNDQLK